MPEPTFVQAERRSFVVPILLAIGALVLAGAIARHFFPATTINIEHVKTGTLSTDTLFKGSTVIGAEKTEHVFFVASTVRIENQLSNPIFVDNFHLTFTNPDDAQLVADGVNKSDLPDLQTNFPGLKPLLLHPLLRDTTIEPGKSAEGTLLFSLQIPAAMWEARKSAVIEVDIYHQHPVYVTIPRP